MSLQKQWWSRSTHGGGFQPFRLPPAEVSHGVSVGCSLVASVRTPFWQANSERGESPAAIPADRGRLQKGVDMLWNIGTIGRHGMQRTAFPNESAPTLVKSQELAKASPAFDAWLEAYRKHLGEACQRANSLHASPANANG
jgi:hypothetical protein